MGCVISTVIYALREARGHFRDRHHGGVAFYRNVLSCCWTTSSRNTGRFIMFSVITNIYNKKTEGPTLMELFTATRKPKKFLFLTTRYVRCVHHWCDTAHIEMTFKFLPHTRQNWFFLLAQTRSFSKLFIPRKNGLVCRRFLLRASHKMHVAE